MDKKEKILLDTDIGSDIDDAYCLSYLLMHPESELLGVTTVSGEAMERAKIADAICKVAGKKIPIYCGSDITLTENRLQTTAKQKTQLPNWPHDEKFSYGAAEFLNKIICENPGEITLCAIGPLTNVAVLFSQYPESPKLLKRLVLMGGAFFAEARQFRPLGEWNTRCDPRAAQIVYSAPVPEIVAVGLDVTMKVTMRQDEVRKNFTSPVLKAVEDFSKVWFEEREISAFHDPLAAMTIFDVDVCTWKRGHVFIERGSAGETTTIFAECECGPCLVAETVDKEMFFEKFFAVTRGE